MLFNTVSFDIRREKTILELWKSKAKYGLQGDRDIAQKRAKARFFLSNVFNFLVSEGFAEYDILKGH